MGLISCPLSIKSCCGTTDTSNDTNHTYPFKFKNNEKGHEKLDQDLILFKYRSQLNVGDLSRISIKYHHHINTPSPQLESDDKGHFLWLRVKNEQPAIVRPVYLTGPFAFYVDCRPVNYDTKKDFDEDVEYNVDIKPNQAFKCQLRLNHNSKLNEDDGIVTYSWTVEIVSQLAVITKIPIDYDLSVGFDYHHLKHTIPYNHKSYYLLTNQLLSVKVQNTESLWSTPPRDPTQPVHLVVITHGIFSNIGADMSYLKGELEAQFDRTGENAIVRGFQGNIGKSEMGIRYLGRRVGDYVMKIVRESEYHIDKISFVGHSLGGPVQAYAIYHISYSDKTFFEKVKPINFICMASPMVGILSEFSKTVSIVLDLGFFSNTGRDLMLRNRLSPRWNFHIKSHKSDTEEQYRLGMFSLMPILEQIIMSPISHHVFCQFQRRTTYANAINDGIVPLRTAALVYLNWQGLDDFETIKRSHKESANKIDDQPNDNLSTVPTVEREDQNKVSEIPVDNPAEQENVPVNFHSDMKVNVSDEHLQDSTSSGFSRPESSPSTEKEETSKFKNCNNQESVNSPKEHHFIINNTSSKHSKRKLESYRRTQTAPQEGKNYNNNNGDEEPQLHIPPVASTFITAANVLLAPDLPQSFIRNPSSRPSSIFHDATYSYDDLPPSSTESQNGQSKSQSVFAKFFDPKDSRFHTQERMARKWHHGMSWRKVLVTLEPDAHNNIVVRRRFTNAWGWAVIDHLVTENFP